MKIAGPTKKRRNFMIDDKCCIPLDFTFLLMALYHTLKRKTLETLCKGHIDSNINQCIGYWKLVSGKFLLTFILFHKFLLLLGRRTMQNYSYYYSYKCKITHTITHNAANILSAIISRTFFT